MRTYIISLFIYLYFNSVCFAEITVTHDFQQFLSDSNSITKVSFPVTTEFSTDPYIENGVSISQVNGFQNQVVGSSQLEISDLTGNVLKVDGPEHINIKLNVPVFSIGFL